MGDIFVEQIIRRRISLSGIVLRALSIFALLVGILLIPRLLMLGFTIAILLGYVVYLTFVYTNVEYEYSLVNGELSIDKILGKRKRKAGEEYDLKKAELIAPIDNPEVEAKSNNVVKANYAGNMGEFGKYALILNGVDGIKGQLMVIIEPNDSLKEAMYKVRPNVFKQ